MNLKKMIFMSILCISASITFFACSKDSFEDENFEMIERSANVQVKVNEQTLKFKDEIINLRKQQKTKGVSNFSNDQIQSMNKLCLEMLKSHGFNESEFKEFINDGDPRLILLGVMFAGVVESDGVVMPPRTKSGFENGGGGSGSGSGETCYGIVTAAKCASRALVGAIGVNELQNMFSAKCLTKTMAKTIFKTALKKVPLVAAIVAIDEFSTCMGWWN